MLWCSRRRKSVVYLDIGIYISFDRNESKHDACLNYCNLITVLSWKENPINLKHFRRKRRCFTISFKFSSIFIILFFNQFNGLFSSIKTEFCREFQPVFTSMVDMFPNCKDVQSAMGQRQRHEYNHGDFCCTWSTTSSLQWKLVQTIVTVFLSISFVGSC